MGKLDGLLTRANVQIQKNKRAITEFEEESVLRAKRLKYILENGEPP
jgi:hypothetical protein